MATGIVSSLLGGGIEGAGKGISAVINAIKGKNPEDAAKIQEILGRHSDLVIQTEADVAKATIAENIALNATAAANIQTEAKGDWYTRDARPSVIWVGLLILAWNYMLIPVLGIHWQVKPVDFPSMFWEVWGIVCTGYVFARTADKVLGGAGGSISGPFSLKAESKGDIPTGVVIAAPAGK